MIARFEEELLIAHALGLTRAQLLTKRQEELDQSICQPLLDRRARGEPTAYITGYQPFMGLDFYVDRSVLIPRPETELLVETAIKQLTTNNSQLTTILDLGTGSGCIAVSLAKFMPNAQVVGIDSSREALAVARKNAEHHHVAGRCEFIQSDIFEIFASKAQRLKGFDLIISNPPYIPTDVIETLQPEVRDWEPRQALDGGKDGLVYIKKIVAESPMHLKDKGRLMFEFGFGQAGAIRQFSVQYFKHFKILNDLSGIERIFTGTL